MTLSVPIINKWIRVSRYESDLGICVADRPSCDRLADRFLLRELVRVLSTLRSVHRWNQGSQRALVQRSEVSVRSCCPNERWEEWMVGVVTKWEWSNVGWKSWYYDWLKESVLEARQSSSYKTFMSCMWKSVCYVSRIVQIIYFVSCKVWLYIFWNRVFQELLAAVSLKILIDFFCTRGRVLKLPYTLDVHFR